MKIRFGSIRRAVRGAAVLFAVTAAACGDLPTGPAPADDLVRGIDVSRWQGAVDWNAVAGDDVEFAFIKATEGGDFTDPRF
ncbi:GH25 family lysozyme, partial [Longimicrobium sp.]|uniref:GH25 family lysozyme n=1 Tax=Longimicrobium sp. TaxID=2029185 RepID=UPI002F92BA2C